MTFMIKAAGEKYEVSEIKFHWEDNELIETIEKTTLMWPDEVGEMFYVWANTNGSWIAREQGAEDDDIAYEAAQEMVSGYWDDLDAGDVVVIDICED